MKDKYSVLDNPAWSALNSQHREFALGSELAKRYQPDIVSFVGFAEPSEAATASLDPLMKTGEQFFIIGDLPPLPDGWEIKNELACVQMVCQSPIQDPFTADVEPLGEKNSREMYELVQLVMPAYYLPDTHRMGNYYGIRQEGRLVAIAGERMRTDNFSELSAICTHPDFTGRKYAQQLITHLVNRHFESGKIPFLHTGTTNERAIRLYEHMGFSIRREIFFRLTAKTK
ncbi:GNAT family N-acetyltransferase [Chitinophaga barathri]|uniref:GNAT family N-acetyltransferase n=1 Tax=Chitinophaga barathri TaxID=1647451 RepID=A0A3N4M6T6_9BACT|nr:GNAT family N-acetyltransferase [Chitinophaga barathri]RPD39001.1 GNAT family N-acetyltransferase [Chitinophaga barathri]